MHQKRNKIKNKWEIAGWRYVKNKLMKAAIIKLFAINHEA